MNPYVAVVLCLLAGWMFQIGFATMQIQRYYKRINTLRHLGRCATGMGGSRYKGRVYAALVVDPATRTVLAAEKMTGVSVFAGFRPVSGLVGRSLAEVLADDGVTAAFAPKLRAAFHTAAQTLHDSFQPPPAPVSELTPAPSGLPSKTVVRSPNLGTPHPTRRPAI